MLERSTKASAVFPAMTQNAWDTMVFEPFRDGVEICRLVMGEPEVALLKYAPGAAVPRHRHMGLETILVLAGVQSDEAGHYPAGTFITNPKGSEHSVWSKQGCVVLIQWERPVLILEDIHKDNDGTSSDA